MGPWGAARRLQSFVTQQDEGTCLFFVSDDEVLMVQYGRWVHKWPNYAISCLVLKHTSLLVVHKVMLFTPKHSCVHTFVRV